MDYRMNGNFGLKIFIKPAMKCVDIRIVLYDTYINTLHGWFNKNFKPEIPIHSVIHLSGGAFKEKLAKDILFPKKLSAEIFDLWEPPQIMRRCAEWRKIKAEE